jgi:organic radical activating enzyme
MKKTARVIATYKCNRSCPGCCNGHGNSVKKIDDIHELIGYEEIILTGGEPMTIEGSLLKFIIDLKDNGYCGKIYLYTAYWNNRNKIHGSILGLVDGITYTIHAEANDEDIKSLKSISDIEDLSYSNFSSRLIIDNRVYDRYDLSNIDLTNWDVIRKLQWKDECKPAANEELVEFLL